MRVLVCLLCSSPVAPNLRARHSAVLTAECAALPATMAPPVLGPPVEAPVRAYPANNSPTEFTSARISRNLAAQHSLVVDVRPAPSLRLRLRFCVRTSPPWAGCRARARRTACEHDAAAAAAVTATLVTGAATRRSRRPATVTARPRGRTAPCNPSRRDNCAQLSNLVKFPRAGGFPLCLCAGRLHLDD